MFFVAKITKNFLIVFCFSKILLVATRGDNEINVGISVYLDGHGNRSITEHIAQV